MLYSMVVQKILCKVKENVRDNQIKRFQREIGRGGRFKRFEMGEGGDWRLEIGDLRWEMGEI